MYGQNHKEANDAVVYGLCPPNQFALAEANKKLKKETEACYAEFPNYRIKKSIHT